MKKSLVISSLVVLAILTVIGAALWRHYSALTGMWAGTHRILSSTDGPDSFNSKECRTWCRLKVSGRQVTGQIPMFGMDAYALRGTEDFHGVIHGQMIEWTSSRSWDDGERRHHQYTVTFQGSLSGSTINGHFEQTWNGEDKPLTYGGRLELKKQPDSAEPGTVVQGKLVAAGGFSRRLPARLGSR